MKLLLFLLLMFTPKGVENGDVRTSDVTVYVCMGFRSKTYDEFRRIISNY